MSGQKNFSSLILLKTNSSSLQTECNKDAALIAKNIESKG